MMQKRFNDTGLCIPEKHYMVNISARTQRIFQMIGRGEYFVINRPRQYGKTTTLYMLDRFLKTVDEYFPIRISFEGIGSDSFKSEEAFITAFNQRLERVYKLAGKTEIVKFLRSGDGLSSIAALDVWLSELVVKTGKKTVLMIDEVDKSSNNQLFLDFLGMLRDKYLRYNTGEDETFHSVILVGVYDIKSLKIKLRPDEEAKYNSPWNIAVDFEIDMGLQAGEIAAMLEEYSQERAIEIDIPFFAGQLFYYTSGYPFLVSYICKHIDEKILPQKSAKDRRKWSHEDLPEALRLVLSKDNTNFQNLVKNLENNPDLYEFVFKIIMNGQEFTYNPRNAIINSGMIHGVLKEDGAKVKVHNRLYEQLIYDYMSSKLETSGDLGSDFERSKFVQGNKLNIEAIVRKFQEFMIEQYSEKDIEFIERNGRLLFLAFIKPIINGKGFDFKEVQVSGEKRLDIVITFGNHKYIIELKIWRGKAYHRAGIEQLCDYLDKQGQTRGYLLIYDLRKKSGLSGQVEKIETKGKEIFAAWL